jgi:hypothetical protein
MSTHHAAYNHVLLEQKLMVHGQPMDPVSKVNVLDRGVGLLHNHALQQVVLIQLKQLAVQILNTLAAARQVVQLALKLMVHGQPMDPVSKVNVLDRGVGLQYRLILILAAIPLQQKLTVQILNILHAARQDVQLVIEVIAHGGHGVPVAKENKLELERGLL